MPVASQQVKCAMWRASVKRVLGVGVGGALHLCALQRVVAYAAPSEVVKFGCRGVQGASSGIAPSACRLLFWLAYSKVLLPGSGRGYLCSQGHDKGCSRVLRVHWRGCAVTMTALGMLALSAK